MLSEGFVKIPVKIALRISLCLIPCTTRWISSAHSALPTWITWTVSFMNHVRFLGVFRSDQILSFTNGEWWVYNGKCLWYVVFKRPQHRFDTFGRILYINAWSERRKASLIHHPSSSKAYMLPPETTESKAFVEYIFNVIHTGVPTRIAFSPALCCDVMVFPPSARRMLPGIKTQFPVLWNEDRRHPDDDDDDERTKIVPDDDDSHSAEYENWTESSRLLMLPCWVKVQFEEFQPGK